jgi:AraC-like DNA-binding protein
MRHAPPVRHLLRARDLIDARYAEPLDVPALAARAHCSTSHFSRSFKRAFGEAPHQYLLTRRIERAGHLLRDTDLPVTEICAAVGWQSLGSFSTTFKRVMGHTPTSYRRAWRASPAAAALAAIPPCKVQAVLRPAGRAEIEKRAGATRG